MKEGESTVIYTLVTQTTRLCPKCNGKPHIKHWTDEYGRGHDERCTYCGPLFGGYVTTSAYTECKRNKNGTFSPLKRQKREHK